MEEDEENNLPLINNEENQIITNEIKEDDYKNENNSQLVEINNKVRTTIYICLVLISAFSSCDGGIIPQQNSNIQKDFGQENDNSLVGFFGSVDYIGRVFGAIIFSFILGKMNRKIILFLTLILKAITLFIAIPFGGSTINIIFRGISGISQVFYTSYLPVWCDQYGKKKQRTLMVMFVQLGNPVGIIIGYGIAMACDLIIPNDSNYSGWRIAFGFEGVILVVCAVIILFFNKKYFSEKFVLLDDNLGREEIKEEKEGENKLINFNNIKKILCNKLFLFTTLSNSISFFGMGIVQYWGDKYMELILKMEANLRFIIFAVLCLLGPILGMIFGGLICSKLGGYGTRKAMIFVIIILIISSIISSLITIDDNMVIFIIFTWSYLFFLCAPISPESGIIISSLDNHLRGDGFALSNSLLNLLGSFPSSYVFGSLSDLYKSKLSNEDVEKNKHFVYAWTTCMAYNYVGVILIIIAGVFRFRIKGDLTNNPEEEIDKIENIGIRSNTLPDSEAKDTVSEE